MLNSGVMSEESLSPTTRQQLGGRSAPLLVLTLVLAIFLAPAPNLLLVPCAIFWPCCNAYSDLSFVQWSDGHLFPLLKGLLWGSLL